MSFGETAKTMAALNKRRKSVLYKRKERTKRECLVEPQNAVDGADEDRAQRLDGAFFEGFVELQEKQKDELEEAAKGTLKREALSSNKYQNDSRSIIKPRSKKQSLDLYKEIMYTIMHRLGARKQGGDNLTDGEIYSYAREVLDISAEEHKQVYDEVKAVKAPECFLNVKVFRAEDVEAKDANGFSDPYCMLCIIKDGEGDKVSDNGNKIKKQVLRHLREENDVKMTKIQMKTLNPEWNQPFKFNVNDLHNQVLRIDMWDKDDNSVILDEENKITSIKGFKGAGRMLKEIYQSAAGGSKNTLDDFLGLVEVPLKNIPENGVDAWFKIESRNNKKTVKGRLRLKISLSTKFDSGEVSLLPDKTNDKEPDRPTSNLSEASANEVYKELLNCCARYDCQQTIDSMQNDSEWQCILSDHAEAILLQYTMQHEIRPLEVAVIKWGIFSKLIQEINIPMDVLSTQMEDFKKHSANDKLDTDYELEQHLESMKIFSDYMIRLIGKYRYTYSNVEQRNVTELGKLLICLLMIHRVPVFTQKYPDLILHKEIEKVLEKSTNEWFFIEEAFHQSMEQDDKDILGYLCHLTNAINADLQRGLEVYEPIFKCINVRYMVVVFNKIETLISQLVEEKTSKIKNNFHQGSKDDVASIWFQLYLAVKGLYQLKKKHIPQDDQNTEGLDNWSSWFRKGVVKLLEIASDKAEARTLKALEMDEVRVIDSMVKHSTSAVDVTCCLGQICIFNNTLEWPDPLGAFTFLAQVVGIVGKCAMDYGHLVFNQLKDKGFYDDVGQFDVTDELCIMMNNTAHVLQFLDYVPKAAQFDQYLDAMRLTEREKDVERSSQTLHNILNCAKEDMRNKLDQIILHVGKRMKESLKDYILKIITNNQKTVDESCDDLLEYIENNLTTLSSSLLSQVFERILDHMWKAVLECMTDLTKKKLLQRHYKKLQELLQIVFDFFHGDGNGLSVEALQGALHQELTYCLQLNSSSTEELIENYFVDQCEQQKAADSSLGKIAFKVFFDNLTKKLNVYVLNAANILPLDSSGKSDPYIKLSVQPQHLFPQVKPQKTKFQKETLYPLFDESFQFSIPPPDCLKNGATLVFSVYDHDRITDDDIGGESYYDLQFVPGLTYDTVQGGFATVPQIDMCLTIPTIESKSVAVMKNRQKEDSTADHFVSSLFVKRSKLLENIQKAKEYNN